MALAQALPYTLLSLQRYARLMGVNPVHFAGATGVSLNPQVYPLSGSCDAVWFKYPWQANEQASRHELAEAIRDAEGELADVVGYWPAPVWIAKEVRAYPRPHRRYAFGDALTVRGQYKSVKARWGKVVEAGRRAVSLVGTATTAGGTLVYSDEDGDGLSETATITLATTLTEACEIKPFFAGEGGAQEWEVRPVRSVAISGGNVVIVLDSWLLIDPELYEEAPQDDGSPSAIDISTTANFVTSVDVYREYTDFAQASAEFYWEPKPYSVSPVTTCVACSGSGCEQCQFITQTGCLHIRDVETGIVVPAPATYDSANGHWDAANWEECREPDQVKLWYRAGEISERYLRGLTCDPLSDWWAQTIAWLATARLEHPFCACGSSGTRAAHLREDLAHVGETSHLLAEEMLTNPFGTRRGEVQAWQRVSRLENRIMGAALI